MNYNSTPGWKKDDPRWANPPGYYDNTTTLVTTRWILSQLSNVSTANCSAEISFGLWLDWTDNRLVNKSRKDELPVNLWSPRLTLQEFQGSDRLIETVEFNLKPGSLAGEL